MSKIAIFRYPLAFNPADGAVPYIISPEAIYREKLHALGYIPVAESFGISLYLQPHLRSAPRKLPNSVK